MFIITRVVKNKVAKNAVWIIMGKVAQSCLALVINMITARYLGPSNYGLISYASSIVAFVVPIMNLGFSNILVQELTNNPDEEQTILGTSIFLSALSSIACMIGILAYTNIADAGEYETNIVVILYSFVLLFQAFELLQYWFQSKLLSKYMTISSLLAYCFIATYKIILLINKASVFLFALTSPIEYMLISLFLFITYKKCGSGKIKIDFSIGKRMLAKSKHFIISSMMITIFLQTDKIMLKLMISEGAVGIYSAAVTCATLTSFVFSAIIDSFRPVILEYKRRGAEASYEKSLIKLYSLVIYLALIQSVVVTLFSNVIINTLYGPQYAESASLLKVVVWDTTFSYMGAVRMIWILSEEKQKYLWILNLAGALLNIVLNAILIPFMGIYGAAIASFFTQVFANYIMNYILIPLRKNNRLINRSLNPKAILSTISQK